MFCIKFQVLLKVLAFFLVEIQLFSAQKQLSFRRRIFDAYVGSQDCQRLSDFASKAKISSQRNNQGRTGYLKGARAIWLNGGPDSPPPPPPPAQKN
jgi:hypothetical protein